jgi:hypothetical protein
MFIDFILATDKEFFLPKQYQTAGTLIGCWWESQRERDH